MSLYYGFNRTANCLLVLYTASLNRLSSAYQGKSATVYTNTLPPTHTSTQPQVHKDCMLPSARKQPSLGSTVSRHKNDWLQPAIAPRATLVTYPATASWLQRYTRKGCAACQMNASQSNVGSRYAKYGVSNLRIVSGIQQSGQ